MTDDEARITDEVTLPAQPVRRQGSAHARGFGEGFGLAVVLVALLGGLGVVAVSSPAAPTAGPSATPLDVGLGGASPSASADGPSPSPTLRPAVTLAAPCARTTPPDPPIAAVHYPGFRYYGIPLSPTWLAEPLPTQTDEYIAEAAVKLGEPLGVSLDNHWCALAWRFYLDGMLVAAQDNPALDPGFASQDAWFVRLPPIADPTPVLRLELRFAQGWTIDTWHLRFDPAPVPTAFVATTSATEEARPGCGFRIQLRIGGPGEASCLTTLPPNEPAQVWVAPDSRIALRIPGATFVPDPTEPILCGHVLGAPADFVVDPTCVLGKADDPSNALTFDAPPAVGEWWVAFQGCASRDGNTACGRWYTIVRTTSP